MNITLTEVLEHTDLAARLAYPRLTATLTKPTVFDNAPKLAQDLERRLESDADRIAELGEGLTVRPLNLADPDANYVNAFEKRMHDHERPFPPRHRVNRPPRRRSLTLNESASSLAEATDQQRRAALAAALDIPNINELED